MLNPEVRLRSFLEKRNRDQAFFPLTPDASTREYFRINWAGSSAIACVYPEPFNSAEQNYLDVSALFTASGLPVADVFDFDEETGVIVIDDFGDKILRDHLLIAEQEERDLLIDDAISLIPRIQAATQHAYDIDSIASRLRFDVEKLGWELDFFKTHYFSTLKNRSLDNVVDSGLVLEFSDICTELDSLALVLCHRDFHAANLMIGNDGQLKIIDHQDARIGSVTYDLVSLLLDRVNELPSEKWLDERKARFFSERSKLGLPDLDRDSFDHEFHLQTIQRCLKAAGTFSFQSANRGKTHFIQYIKPMFLIVLNAINKIGKYPVLNEVLSGEIYEKN